MRCVVRFLPIVCLFAPAISWAVECPSYEEHARRQCTESCDATTLKELVGIFPKRHLPCGTTCFEHSAELESSRKKSSKGHYAIARTTLVEALAEFEAAKSLPGELQGDVSQNFKELAHKFAIERTCPTEEAKDKRAIMPGDSTDALSPVDVSIPTNGKPQLVVLHITSPIVGPDGSLLNLVDASLEAIAQASPTDRRILFRLRTLQLSKPQSAPYSVAVDGWILGNDGIRGIPGEILREGSENYLHLDSPKAITIIFSSCAVFGE